MKKEEVISSLELEDYLNNFINDADNSLQEKIIMSSFLSEHTDKNLFIVEFIRDGALYIRVEDENDKIISKELFIGELIEAKKPNVQDFELLTGTDHTINFHVDSILNDDSINSDDKIFMIKDFLKHLNKGLYRMDATDKEENMCQLVLKQETDEIIDIIYY